ncbi:MAG: DUF366 family protein [Armatimonadota bacterium]
MLTRLLDREITYTGAQLRSGWIAEVAGLSGDAAIAFLGPCDVAPEHMVDTVDLQAGARIYSPRMLHIIVEHPGLDLIHVTVRQRLLIATAGETINTHLGEPLLRREGDDLYLRDRKLSVSVATVGTAGGPGTAGFGLPPADRPQAEACATLPSVSGLIHAGFNVRGEGAPVPAIGLEELGLDPRAFAERLLAAYAAELQGISSAAAKVRPVL